MLRSRTDNHLPVAITYLFFASSDAGRAHIKDFGQLGFVVEVLFGNLHGGNFFLFFPGCHHNLEEQLNQL